MHKVSLIIPCYNCEKYADTMQGSILAQDWDNIEIILVDDGSTDNTGKILLVWVEKFKTRGFDAYYIHKENGGVTSAINTGLRHFTGDYVCFLDHDDRLEHCYVSDMAKYLDENPAVNWVRCDASYVYESDPYTPVSALFYASDSREYPSFLTKYLCGETQHPVWTTMIRSEYLKKCLPSMSLPEGLPIQEHPIQIPLAYAGDPAIIHKPNYRYYKRERSTAHMWRKNTDKWIEAFLRVKQAAHDEINKLPASVKEKELYHNLVFLYDVKRFFYTIGDKNKFNALFSDWVIKLGSMADDILNLSVPLNYNDVLNNIDYLRRAIIDEMLNLETVTIPERFLVYGYGEQGKFWLNRLKLLNFLPEEIWDISAKKGDCFHAVPVVVPHPADYSAEQAGKTTVFVLIGNKSINDSVVSRLRGAGFTNTLGFHDSVNVMEHIGILR